MVDGNHTLRVEVSDRASNSSIAEASFLIDTMAPTASFETPTDNSFTNDDTPDIRIAVADVGRDIGGTTAPPSGLDLSSVRVFLRSGGPGAPEIDLTSTLIIGAALVSGTLTDPLLASPWGTPPLVIGAAGEALSGLGVVSIPATATSESRVDPAVLPPTGGTATGSLRLDSPSSLPSGTVVQADVEETYTLASGEEASAAKRSTDILVFKTPPITGDPTCAPTTAPDPNAPPAEHLCAAFPITPSRTYATSALREGRVHLDLLAGRENARGVVGGNEATTVTSGTVQLNVAAGSLAEDTAIALVAYDTFSPFVPATNGIIPLGEVTVDFASSTLNTSAALTFNNIAAAPGDTLVVARVDRAAYDGIPRLQVVALADVLTANGETRAVSRADTGLPGVALDGITREGRYVLLQHWPAPSASSSGQPTWSWEASLNNKRPSGRSSQRTRCRS